MFIAYWVMMLEGQIGDGEVARGWWQCCFTSVISHGFRELSAAPGGLEAWSNQSRNNGSIKYSQMVVGQWRTTGFGLSCCASQRASQSGMGKEAETWMFSRWERGRALCQWCGSWWKLFREGKSAHWPLRGPWTALVVGEGPDSTSPPLFQMLFIATVWCMKLNR